MIVILITLISPQYPCLISTHIISSWFVVLHLLDLLWRFLHCLLCLLFFLDFPQSLPLSFISHRPVLSFHSQKSLSTFHSLNSWGSTLPRGSFTPSVSSRTRHSLRSFTINLSFYTFPSLGSVWPQDARHSRCTI